MFTSRLNKYNNKLTYSDRLIAKVLLKNYQSDDDFVVMTSEEIANVVGCGQATVIRFSQKLGYPSFKSMMLELANDSVFYERNEVQEDASIGEIQGRLQHLYNISVNDVTSYNNDDDLEKAVHYLENAKTIFCFGIRSSYATVLLLYYRLLETGRKVLRAETLLEGVSIARNLEPEDVVFAMSVSGETKEVVTVLNAAKKAGAKIISITASQNNAVQKLSDVALKSAEYNMHTNRFNLVNRTSEVFLVDCLFIKLWRNNEEKLVQGINDFNADYSEENISDNESDEVFRL